MHSQRLILASTSPYRAQLLARLPVQFEQIDPKVEEANIAGESPEQMALRLAANKAKAGLKARPDGIVIGSDQVYELDGLALGKPGQRASAVEQLQRSSGRVGVFHTAVTVISATDLITENIQTKVQFRPLSADQINRYVDAEQAFDCAGSFRSERFGISLFEWIRSDDPTAIIGLPLIALVRMLDRFGLSLP